MKKGPENGLKYLQSDLIKIIMKHFKTVSLKSLTELNHVFLHNSFYLM